VEIFAEIEKEFGTSVLDWLKSCVGQSMAKAEFDRLSTENPEKSSDYIINELREMTVIVKGKNIKLFSDGTISHLVATVAERVKVRAEYHKLREIHHDWSDNRIIDEMKKSGKFSAGNINLLASRIKKSDNFARLRELEKNGKSKEENMETFRNEKGDKAADGMEAHKKNSDCTSRAWEIYRKWKGKKSLEEIRDAIRAEKDLGDKYANVVYNHLTKREKIITHKLQGLKQQVGKAKKALENEKKVLISIHNPVDCKEECLIIWDCKERHKQNRASINTKVGDIKFDQVYCSNCCTYDRDITFKNAVTNEGYETILFDKKSGVNVVQLKTVAALTAWSKEKEKTIRQRHELMPASVAAAKRPPVKKDKPTKSKPESKPKAFGEFEPGPHDVLIGRGGGTTYNPGNKRFRQLICTRKDEYKVAKRSQRSIIAQEIVTAWRAQVPPGRFLKQDENTKLWNDIGNVKAKETTAQKLRDSIKDKPVSSETSKQESKRKASEEIVRPGPHDVLVGRGGGSRDNPGNKRFRQLICTRKDEYKVAKQSQRPIIAQEIVTAWRAQAPPGRFLKQDENTKLWYDIGNVEAKLKTTQKFRDSNKDNSSWTNNKEEEEEEENPKKLDSKDSKKAAPAKKKDTSNSRKKVIPKKKATNTKSSVGAKRRR